MSCVLELKKIIWRKMVKSKSSVVRNGFQDHDVTKLPRIRWCIIKQKRNLMSIQLLKLKKKLQKITRSKKRPIDPQSPDRKHWQTSLPPLQALADSVRPGKPSTPNGTQNSDVAELQGSNTPRTFNLNRKPCHRMSDLATTDQANGSRLLSKVA